MMFKGTVKFWVVERGYGFISRDDGQPDAFVHISGTAAGVPLVTGQRVSFEMATDERSKRARAVNVKVEH